MPTIREVAQKAQVSYTTVSHVINNTRFVTEETRQRVLAAMEALNYRPNNLARALRRGETCTLGLILPDSANPFFAEVGRSIEEAAFEKGYNIILCNSEGNQDKELRYVKVLSEKQMDGIIFMATGDETGSLLSLMEQDIPIVLVDRELPEIETDLVLADNWQGGYLSTQHLIDLGHRRIGCIAGPSFLTPSAQRVTGYRQALSDAGLAYDENLVVQGDFHPQTGREGAHQLLALAEPPSAIFVCNDMMAIGVLSMAAALGLRVPDELSVVGFDNIDLGAYAIPPLTTYAQPKVLIGQSAVGMLLERIQDRRLPARRMVLPGSLVVRKSSGVKQ